MAGKETPALSKGTVFPSETRTFVDNETGVTISRLTNHLCHSNHFYFTHWPYYSGGQKMVFHSDRGNARNLFGIDIETGEITQLTEFKPGTGGVEPFGACVSYTREEAYFYADRCLYALDLCDLSQRKLWEWPEDVKCTTPNCTADGRFVCFVIIPYPPKELPIDPTSGGPSNKDMWASKPHCRIVRIPIEGGEPETLWEEDHYITHVNTSPTKPSILTFCHEGPWRLVDQRMWGLDMETKCVWPIRKQDSEDIIIGHEYWFADGVGIGYHGRWGRGADAERFWGCTDYHGMSYREYPIPRACTHFHSLGKDLLVGDGTAADPYVTLWRWNGKGYDGKLLCRHYCSFHTQRLHVHPAMMPDGKGIVFTSDMHGYGNIYLVRIPEFESLPSA